MLAIRMQRIGRKGLAQYRVVVQDSRFSPKSGRVVAYVGSYDPHAKSATLDKDKISNYISNGAQPSPRVARLLKDQKVKLPAWIEEPTKKKRQTRKSEKLRKNRPADAPPAPAPAPAAQEPAQAEAPSETPTAEETLPTEATPEAPPSEAPPQEAPEPAAKESKPSAE